MAHTPGPWEVAWVRGTRKGSVARIMLNGSTVYQVSDVTDPEFPSGKARYNLTDLHLMAAAPTLLDELKHMVSIWEDAIGYESAYMPMADAARSAIAKAEGRTA